MWKAWRRRDVEYVGVKKKQGSIVEVLKDAILSGDIPNGTEMTQNELAQSLGVSRMPVREALILLEYQGLIDRLPNNHVKVSQLTDDFFHHVFRHAAMLETEALKGWQDLEALPDQEMEFHREIWKNHRYSFSKKALETLIEIYTAFVVNSGNCVGSARKLAAVKMLWKSGEQEEGEKALFEYFGMLADAMVAMRRERGDGTC